MALVVAVRAAQSDDADALVALCGQHGYPSTQDDVTRRLHALLARPDAAVFVACVSDCIIGFVHVAGVSSLLSDGYAEVLGLVVLETQRRQGIGRLLVNAAEQWSMAAGFCRMRLRSGVQREDAHRFYERIGYARSRASFAFQRTLD